MSGGHDKRYEEMLPLYALGTLDGDELRDLEAHLATGCPTCEAELDDWREQTETLAELTPAIAPSAATRDRILTSILGEESSAGREDDRSPERADVTPIDRPHAAEAAPRRAPEPWLSRIAAALALVALGWTLWTTSGVDRERERLASDLAGAQDELSRLQAELDRAEPDLALVATARRLLGSPALEQASLAGLGEAPAASARAYFSAEGGDAIFFVENLPEIASDKTYQLWYIGAEGPIPAGVFDGPEATVIVPDVPDAEAIQLWAVTVEEAGGVDSPTLDAMVLKS